ncbi:MAG TPA: hypothetical protein ENI92_08685, partial [Bacteroidetes bacterium]|nr:hypothetical protein [Bacteroidota bacterium]
MALRVLVLGNPWVFREARHFDIRTFVIRIENDTADLNLPPALYNAPGLVALARESGFEADAVFVGDESLPPWLYGLEEIDIPLVWYAIDSHIHQWHEHYCAAFDLLLIAQPTYRELFTPVNRHGEIRFLPLYA